MYRQNTFDDFDTNYFEVNDVLWKGIIIFEVSTKNDKGFMYLVYYYDSYYLLWSLYVSKGLGRIYHLTTQVKVTFLVNVMFAGIAIGLIIATNYCKLVIG